MPIVCCVLTDVLDIAKNFIDRLLTFGPEKRITAHEALKHPWITDDKERGPRTSTNLVPTILKGFSSRRSLKSIVTALTILNRWKHELMDVSDSEESDEAKQCHIATQETHITVTNV